MQRSPCGYIGVYVCRVYLTGGFTKPREVTWITATAWLYAPFHLGSRAIPCPTIRSDTGRCVSFLGSQPGSHIDPILQLAHICTAASHARPHACALFAYSQAGHFWAALASCSEAAYDEEKGGCRGSKRGRRDEENGPRKHRTFAASHGSFARSALRPRSARRFVRFGHFWGVTAKLQNAPDRRKCCSFDWAECCVQNTFDDTAISRLPKSSKTSAASTFCSSRQVVPDSETGCFVRDAT